MFTCGRSLVRNSDVLPLTQPFTQKIIPTRQPLQTWMYIVHCKQQLCACVCVVTPYAMQNKAAEKESRFASAISALLKTG